MGDGTEIKADGTAPAPDVAQAVHQPRRLHLHPLLQLRLLILRCDE